QAARQRRPAHDLDDDVDPLADSRVGSRESAPVGEGPLLAGVTYHHADDVEPLVPLQKPDDFTADSASAEHGHRRDRPASIHWVRVHYAHAGDCTTRLERDIRVLDEQTLPAIGRR